MLLQYSKFECILKQRKPGLPVIYIRICIRNQTNTLRFCREDNPLYVFTLWRCTQEFEVVVRKNVVLHSSTGAPIQISVAIKNIHV